MGTLNALARPHNKTLASGYFRWDLKQPNLYSTRLSHTEKVCLRKQHVVRRVFFLNKHFTKPDEAPSSPAQNLLSDWSLHCMDLGPGVNQSKLDPGVDQSTRTAVFILLSMDRTRSIEEF